MLYERKVAVLQPFLKTTAAAAGRGQRQSVPQDQPRASASFDDACSKLDEAVALVDTLGCEVVLKEVRQVTPTFNEKKKKNTERRLTKDRDDFAKKEEKTS